MNNSHWFPPTVRRDEQERLLDAIETPGDMLMFADWLEERGDERSSKVREAVKQEVEFYERHDGAVGTWVFLWGALHRLGFWDWCQAEGCKHGQPFGEGRTVWGPFEWIVPTGETWRSEEGRLWPVMKARVIACSVCRGRGWVPTRIEP